MAAHQRSNNVHTYTNSNDLPFNDTLNLSYEPLTSHNLRSLVKAILNENQTELVVVEQRLEDIKRPRFLRTRSEKEEQIRDAAKNIRIYEDNIIYLNNLLSSIDNGLPYELSDYLNERKQIARSR